MTKTRTLSHYGPGHGPPKPTTGGNNMGSIIHEVYTNNGDQISIVQPKDGYGYGFTVELIGHSEDGWIERATFMGGVTYLERAVAYAKMLRDERNAAYEKVRHAGIGGTA